MDLVAVERRDEGLVQERDGLMRDLVGGALGGVDALRVGLEVGKRAEHRRELAAAFEDAVGMRVEKIEELSLARHQASEHDYSLVPRPSDLSVSIAFASKPQSASAACPPSPRSGGERRTPPGVREKRGAGAGCSTPATST
jgi:hypothetical protein